MDICSIIAVYSLNSAIEIKNREIIMLMLLYEVFYPIRYHTFKICSIVILSYTTETPHDTPPGYPRQCT